jgi:hypothetical protein
MLFLNMIYIPLIIVIAVTAILGVVIYAIDKNAERNEIVDQ